MDAEDVDGTDYDKTFIEEPAILDKYKAAAEVCESTYHHLIFFFIICQHTRAADAKQARRLTSLQKHYIIIIKDCSVLIVRSMPMFLNFARFTFNHFLF